MNLFTLTGSADDAVEHILDFYSNYHSQRYVEGRLVLRIRRAPEAEHLEGLSRDFEDILVSGKVEIVQPSAAEVAEADNLDLIRLGLHFDRRSYGRLRILIDRLNRLVATPEHVEPPRPFEEEQAERPW
jgi:hypothetical protein